MNATSRLIAGILLLTVSDLRAAFLFVSPTSTNPTPPYDSWATAATNIQDAVTAAQPGSLVLVTNGIYSGGLVVDKPIFILSVMGAQFTAIDGGGTNRCVWMTNGTKLEGFTVTSGWAGTDGGGVWCSSTNAWVTNCVLAGNAASGTGGGAFGGLLGRCTLRGNTAGSGGGAASATLNDCAVAGNRAVADGGGVFQCYLNNCLLTTNSSNTGGALLTSSGTSSLSSDSLQFTASGEKPTATSIFLQGTQSILNGVVFGQGVRCVGGTLKRLYTHTASGGTVSAPVGADAPVHVRSAALGDPITFGSQRFYQVYYRDPTVLGGCPSSSTFNVGNGQAVTWIP